MAKVNEIKDVPQLHVSYLRVKNPLTCDTFVFPPNPDEGWVEREHVIGVLSQLKGTTKRLNSVVKISPSLQNFYTMR